MYVNTTPIKSSQLKLGLTDEKPRKKSDRELLSNNCQAENTSQKPPQNHKNQVTAHFQSFTNPPSELKSIECQVVYLYSAENKKIDVKGNNYHPPLEPKFSHKVSKNCSHCYLVLALVRIGILLTIWRQT